MATPERDDAAIVISLERVALERWADGDPGAFLDLSDPEVSYFDPFAARRLDGLAALRSLYEQLRGRIHIDRFEMIAPRVQIAGDVAVLTYRFDSYGSDGVVRWNTTEVYRKNPDGWKIIHTHWAFHQPKTVA